jgi:hypothetical protein
MKRYPLFGVVAATALPFLGVASTETGRQSGIDWQMGRLSLLR